MSDYRSMDASAIRSGIRSDTGKKSANRWARTLSAIIEQSQYDESRIVRKSELGCGDRVIVRTRNSTYSLCVLGDDTFAVSGGWFERRSGSATLITINGCTYGGSVIRHDVVAGPGLFLEFGNNVLTTRIQDVRVVRSDETVGPGPQLPC
jgi:hypothetical protein